jgi:hypothetical protein
MKVASSAIAVRSQFPELFEQALDAVFAQKPPKEAPEDEAALWLWNWTWRPSTEVRLPKSWSALAKTDPKAHTVVGCQKGYACLGLEARRNGKKIWCAESLKLEKAPEELWRELGRRANPALAAPRWSGLLVDLWQPLHQRHPGLAEHALIGAFEIDGERHYLLSDRPDPLSASMWSVFSLDPKNGCAWPQMRVFDRDSQRAFLAARTQQTFSWMGAVALRVADAQTLDGLGGVKAFSWKLDPSLPTEQIPDSPRRFKLGEEVIEAERRSLSVRERALLGQRPAPATSAKTAARATKARARAEA